MIKTTNVYKAGSVYKCLKWDGEVLAKSSTNAETVLQTALDQKGNIDIGSGPWLWGSSVPIKVKSDSNIVCAADCIFRLPSGYTDEAILFDTAYNTDSEKGPGHLYNVRWKGGEFREQTTFAQNFDGFHIVSSVADKGVYDIVIEDTQSYYSVDRAFLMETTHVDAWITEIKFSNNLHYSPRVGWEMKKIAGAPYNFINRCMFDHCRIQAGSTTNYGFKAIDGDSQEFYHCLTWDIHLGAAGCKKSQFLSTAKDIIIIGGSLTGVNGTDWDRQCPELEIRVNDAFSVPTLEALRTKDITYLPSQEGTYTVAQTGTAGAPNSTFAIPHGLGVTPTKYSVEGISRDSRIGPFSITSVDSTNINIEYLSILPPPATAGNPNNLTWRFVARP